MNYEELSLEIGRINTEKKFREGRAMLTSPCLHRVQLALIMSEFGELVEAVRKHDEANIREELADLAIRCLDYYDERCERGFQERGRGFAFREDWETDVRSCLATIEKDPELRAMSGGTQQNLAACGLVFDKLTLHLDQRAPVLCAVWSDALIRWFGSHYGWDWPNYRLGRQIEAKLAINRERPVMHGKGA